MLYVIVAKILSVVGIGSFLAGILNSNWKVALILGLVFTVADIFLIGLMNGIITPEGTAVAVVVGPAMAMLGYGTRKFWEWA